MSHQIESIHIMQKLQNGDYNLRLRYTDGYTKILINVPPSALIFLMGKINNRYPCDETTRYLPVAQPYSRGPHVPGW